MITSEERPDRLADHFELKQWAIDDERCKNVRTRRIVGVADTDTGRISVGELRITVRKLRNYKIARGRWNTGRILQIDGR